MGQTISILPDTYEELTLLKRGAQYQNYDQTIRYLLRLREALLIRAKK